MVNKGWKGQLRDQCIFGENEEVLLGKNGVILLYSLPPFIFPPLGGEHRG
jgi:hypothetical protein